MSGVRVTVKTAKAKARLLRVQAALTPERIDPIIDQEARQTHARLVKATPRGWFGQVRQDWTVLKPREGMRVVTNPNPVMLFLEEGTKAHGPRAPLVGPLQPGRVKRVGERKRINNEIAPRQRHALFIPLTKRAALANRGTFEVGPHDIKVSKSGDVRTVRALFKRTSSIRKGKVRLGEVALIFGRDYILARRVKGIPAMHIVAKERPRTAARLKMAFKAHLRSAIRG